MEYKKTIEKIKEEFERDGVVVIPGVFTQDEVNKIRAEAYFALAEAQRVELYPCYDRVRNQFRIVDGVRFPALTFFPSLTSVYLNKVRTDKRVSDLVSAFLGPDIKQINNQVYFRLPGDKDEFAWHQDIFFRIPKEDFPGIESAYLQTLIVVDEITEENGAVEYVLGSHKNKDLELLEHNSDAPKNLRTLQRGQFHGTKITAKPGDMLMWSTMIIHASDQNNTTSPRMTYMNGFASASASKYHPYYMKDGKIIEKIDPSLFPENMKK